ncbi:hypothetical protein OsI_37357 [Oryza sativa Indica Group]|uniref:Uncharacterized protein n=1 Tax=Oryza sativa subsp. indica TaxID=39946 RepID=B8BLV7_ORYSI|nr:hypothetical protein OsI_37357 [Oryza sativa Indica Group]
MKLCEEGEDGEDGTDEDIAVGLLGSIIRQRIRHSCNSQIWSGGISNPPQTAHSENQRKAERGAEGGYHTEIAVDLADGDAAERREARHGRAARERRPYRRFCSLACLLVWGFVGELGVPTPNPDWDYSSRVQGHGGGGGAGGRRLEGRRRGRRRGSQPCVGLTLAVLTARGREGTDGVDDPIPNPTATDRGSRSSEPQIPGNFIICHPIRNLFNFVPLRLQSVRPPQRQRPHHLVALGAGDGDAASASSRATSLTAPPSTLLPVSIQVQEASSSSSSFAGSPSTFIALALVRIRPSSDPHRPISSGHITV